MIAHRGAPLVVYGGPGTGKTTTLIESVISRVRAGVDPNSILILTYGRERASELRDAIALRAGSTSFEPLARTFHALSFSILNQKLAQDNARYVLISGGEQDLAIAQMLSNPLVTIPWHSDLALAVNTRGFVREVRDLILRATEMGLSAKDLQQRGKLLNEKYWDGAAHFWASYRGANELQSATVGEQIVHIDPSAIISEAIYHGTIVSDDEREELLDTVYALPEPNREPRLRKILANYAQSYTGDRMIPGHTPAIKGQGKDMALVNWMSRRGLVGDEGRKAYAAAQARGEV